MEQLPRLNFPLFRFKISTNGGVRSVWDTVRRGWYVLTPEEWVRQNVMRYFMEVQSIAPGLIVAEHPVEVQGMAQRADVVILSRGCEPLMLVECKAASVAIDAGVYAQAVRYNAVIGARYIMLTNGLRHYCYELYGDGEYRALEALPQLA